MALQTKTLEIAQQRLRELYIEIIIQPEGVFLFHTENMSWAPVLAKDVPVAVMTSTIAEEHALKALGSNQIVVAAERFGGDEGRAFQEIVKQFPERTPFIEVPRDSDPLTLKKFFEEKGFVLAGTVTDTAGNVSLYLAAQG